MNDSRVFGMQMHSCILNLTWATMITLQGPEYAQNLVLMLNPRAEYQYWVGLTRPKVSLITETALLLSKTRDRNL